MEYIYQYLWQHGLFGRHLELTDGRPLEVVRPGRLNRDAGPDFFNALLHIDSSQWAGNVEIHVRASDWYRHGHHNDPAYDSVVLHVVGDYDGDIRCGDGRRIPTLKVDIPEGFAVTHAQLCDDRKGVRCSHMLSRLDPLAVADWIDSLATERLQDKARRIADWLNEFGGDWHRTCFVALARGLGFGLNAIPFELLAKAVPLGFAARHADNLFQLEALLFGQAGMLDESRFPYDDYYQQLCHEYKFLAIKYSLSSAVGPVWKYARTRPANFPHRRIAILASALASVSSFRDYLMNSADTESNPFDWQPSPYWQTHISFGSPEIKPTPAMLSRRSRDLLKVNVLVPFLYAYGSMSGRDSLTERAVEILEQLPPERNAIIEQWKICGIPAADSFRSQALLQLRGKYCDSNRCLDCRFGFRFLRDAMAIKH